MNFLIIGANFYNKGAQLMLLTLVKELSERYPNCNLIASAAIGEKKQLEELGFKLLNYPLLEVGDYIKFPFYLKYGRLVKSILKKYQGEINFSEIDIIFDIAGFAYGDQWGPDVVENLVLLLRKGKKLNIKYILMPQAFGPFEKPKMKDAMAKALQLVDLAFARDSISLKCLKAIQPNMDQKILLSPDITLTFSQDKTEKLSQCVIVPNVRMLDKADESWKEAYLPTLTKIVQTILNNTKLNIIVLIHAKGGGDMLIAKKIMYEFDDITRVKLVNEEDPILIKKLIGSSQFLVGSRFHALASALSLNIPCLCIGWSHKYLALFSDYGLNGYVFLKPDDSIYEKLIDLIDPTSNQKIIPVLKEANLKIRSSNERMWEEIEKTTSNVRHV